MTVVPLSSTAHVRRTASFDSWIDGAVEWVHLLAERALLWCGLRAQEKNTRCVAARREEFLTCDPRAQELGEKLRRLELELAERPDEPLSSLRDNLGLSELETQLLMIAAVVELEPSLRSTLARLTGQTEATYLNWSALGHLLGRRSSGGAGTWNAMRWKLVVEEEIGPREPVALRIDPFVLAYLQGEPVWDFKLNCSRLSQVTALAHWRVTELARSIEAGWRNAPVRVLVTGSRGAGRRSFAGCVAAQLETPLLFLDSSGASEEEFAEIHLRAQRQALLLGHAWIWSADYGTRKIPSAPALVPLQFVLGELGGLLPPSEGVIDWTEKLDPPGLSARADLWRRYVPTSALWEPNERARVMERYQVQVGDIVALSLRGASTVEEVSQGCRALSRGRLDGLAELLECPFVRSDLVVPPAVALALDDFLHEAAARPVFWEKPAARRLFPRGRGLIALLAGPPGTGKTMSAQVVAAELGLDLVRIDLASIVSKYIGETAKNLQKLFAQISGMNAVLFFDEADALFAKRTEVKDSHDRHANADTNYLLQQLEEFDGIALLSTNKKANIDKAFVRRLRYVLDFTLPKSAERQQIFEAVLTQLVPAESERLVSDVIPVLADSFELSGAQIKLSVLAALFSAQRAKQPLSVEHLLLGIERELGKEGRYLVKTDRTRVLARLEEKR